MNVKQTEEKKIGYRDLLTQRQYLKMVAANMVNRFGDSVDALAFVWIVYAITGSAAWSAIIFGLNHLPTIFIQPFAGAIVEGMRKKRLMIITDILRGLIVAGFAGMYMTDLVTPAVLVVFTLIISTVESFRIPAGTAFVPKILEKEYYETGTGLSNTLSMVIELLGTGLAGIIIGVLGIGTAILIDAATFFISAFIIVTIRYKETQLHRQRVDIKGYVETLKGGVSYIRKRKIVMNFCMMAFLLNAFLTPINSLLTPLVVDVMKRGSEFLSVLGVSLSVGMGIASFLYPFLARKIKVNRLIYVCGSLIGVFYLCYPLAGRLADYKQAAAVICILGMFGMGAVTGVLMAVLSVQLMKVVEEDYLARVASVFNAGGTAAMPIMSAITGVLAAVFDISEILVVSAGLCMVIFICMEIAKVKFAEE